MRVATLCLLSVVVLLASASVVSALVADCNVNSLGLFRSSFPNGDSPIIQVPPFTNLGFPFGYSPFYRQTATGVELLNASPYPPQTGPIIYNIIPVLPTGVFAQGISNNRMYINVSIGIGSTAPFYPSITLSFNGVYYLGSSATNFISTAQWAGFIPIFEVFNVLPNSNNTLIINATGLAAPITGGTATCGRLYYVNISNTNISTIQGDPQFVGLRGQSFQVHGIDGAVYNIISDKQAQVNSRFVFLNGPRACPVMPSTGKKSSACWSHPGSYLGDMGIVTSGGDRIFIQSGPAASGFATVTLNDEPMAVEDAATLSYSNSQETTEVHFISTHEIYVQAGPYIIEFENIDSFLNLRSVSVVGSISRLSSHGLLGQTWQNKRYSSSLKVIQGEVDDYVVADDDIFGTQFLYNQFSLTAQ